jgi:iron complex transport system substrate-binding protein
LRAGRPRSQVRFALIVFLIAIVFSCGACDKKASPTSTSPSKAASQPVRIISLTPAVTEILYRMDLEDRIAGVTKFCVYPPKTKSKPKVGGFTDLNFETVLKLDPDLVILTPYHGETINKLKSLGIRTLVLKIDTLAEIRAAVRQIGKATASDEKARRLLDEIDGGLKSAAAGRTKAHPRVMIVAGRNPGSLLGLFVAGRDNFLNELFEAAGAENIFHDVSGYPQPAVEQIMRRNPQYIIELRTGSKLTDSQKKEIASEWRILGDVDAVRNKRVFVWDDDFLPVPGPRIVLTARKIERTLNGR